MTLGQALKRFRKEKGVSVEDLADKIYVYQNTIRKYEYGYTEPRLTRVAEICRALNVDILDLLKEVDICQN